MAFSKVSSRLIDPVARVLARAVEESPAALEVLRGVPLKGKGRIVARLGQKRLARDIVACCDGINFRLDLADDVQREIYFNLYERHDVAFAIARAPEGGTCLDIGANVGIYSLQLARKVGPRGVVHAFEPDGGNHARLTENVRLNAFARNVRVHRVALSHTTGTARFFKSDAAHSGWGSLESFGDIAQGSEEVPTLRLDDFLDREGLHHVDLAKIDVEAHELELLAGAQEALKNKVLRAVLVEFNGVRLAERGHSLAGFLDAFARHGYRPVELNLDLLARMQQGSVRPEQICTNLLFRPTA